jgi:phage FluMu protein Com
MPIRFRCRYCNQLMGIARRKAGTMVHCPTCHAQVVVPPTEAEADEPPQPKQPLADAPAPLFERSDFEAFLDNPVAEPPRPVEFPAPQQGADAPRSPAASPFSAVIPPAPSLSLSPAAAHSRTAGVFLSPSQATWLTVVVILLVALAFGAGLLVGHYWMG